MIGEEPSEAPSSREVTFKPEYANTQQETEETEQLEYALSKGEDLGVGKLEEEQ